MFHAIGRREHAPANTSSDRIGFTVYVTGGLIFVLSSLYAGNMSVARRMATHFAEWMATHTTGSIDALLVVLAMLDFAILISVGLLRTPKREGPRGRAANAVH